MAKVSNVQSGAALRPSEQVIHAANQVEVVTDARGRKISVRKLTMSIRRRVIKSLSPEMNANQRYLWMAMVAACVVEMDAQIVDPLANGGSEVAFDAVIDRLDDDGFEAVANIISGSDNASEQEVKNS